MEEDRSSCHIISLILEREASTEYKPCEPGEIFRRNVQNCTLSFVHFYKMYSTVFRVGHPAEAYFYSARDGAM